MNADPRGQGAEVATTQATFKQALITLAETEIDAPFAGEVGMIDARVDEQVAPEAVLLRLVNQATW